MTVFYQKDRDRWRYDFRYRGARHVSPRGFPTKREADDAEAALRRRLRRSAAGLEDASDADSPAIADWAETYMDVITERGRLRDVDSVETTLRVVLRFWGRKPDRDLAPHEAGPYHDLKLRDPIDDPEWLLRFEAWMAKRTKAGSTKNNYRTAMSRLYKLALQPMYRKMTNVAMNPFAALERDTTRRRTTTVTPTQLRALMQHAAPHLKIALAIAALAPKLRLDNVLGLRWTDIDDEWAWIVVAEHKTVGLTGLPLVSPITWQLRAILEGAKARAQPGVPWVVSYHRKRLVKLDSSLKSACRAAGLRYGRKDGITFHTIRHSAATWLAALGVSEALRKGALGQRSIATTQIYTHLQPVHERAPLELLSASAPLEDLMVGKAVEVSRRSARSKGSDDEPAEG